MDKYLVKVKTWWKTLDKETFFYYKVAPVIGLIALSFLLGTRFSLGGTSVKNGQQVSGTLDDSIAKSVDFPTMAKEIQSKELLVLNAQLATLSDGTEVQNESDFQKVLTGLNAHNELDSFFGALLAVDYKDDIATQYETLARYLGQDNYSDNSNTNTVQTNIYNFLDGKSYAKETSSQTAKVGVVISSLMTGSNFANRYYACIVPATNSKNEQSNLLYFVQLTQNGKIVDVSYAGQIKNGDLAGTFKDMAQVFAKVSTK